MRFAPATWKDLQDELDSWHLLRRYAELWWRDDDAVRAELSLDRLIALAGDLPLALAVIPGLAEKTLVQRVRDCPNISVLQHGWMHKNHAPAHEKRAELGGHRPLDQVLGELTEGWSRLAELFGRQAHPILTPPWNRIDDALVPRLHGIAYTGLSTCNPRLRREPGVGIVQVNVHVDVTDWGTRRFIGDGIALGQLVTHLSARRTGRADPGEATGIMTHHQLLDRESEAFLVRLIKVTREHPGMRWINASQAFATL